MNYVAIFYILRLLFLLPMIPMLLLIRYNRKLRFLDNIECLMNTLILPSSEFSYESNREWIRFMERNLAPNWLADFAPWLEAKFPALGHCIDAYTTADGAEMNMLKVMPPGVAHDATVPVMILYFHSGGMVGGCPLDPPFKQLVAQYGDHVVIVAAEHRRAIDGHHWPVGLEDSYACVAHLSQQTNALVVTGHSSGAYLALACGLRARTDKLMKIHHLIPIAPTTHIDHDGSRATSSSGRDGRSGLFTLNNSISLYAARFIWHWWVSDADHEKPGHDLRVTAAKTAHTLALLPSMTMVLMECDCTRAEAEDLHNAVVDAGGRSKLIRMPASHSHGGNFIFDFEEGRRAFDEVILPLIA